MASCKPLTKKTGSGSASPRSGSFPKCHGSTTLIPPYRWCTFTGVLLYPSRVVCSHQPVSCAYYAWFNQSLTLLPAPPANWFLHSGHPSLGLLTPIFQFAYMYGIGICCIPVCVCPRLLYSLYKTNPVLRIRIRINFRIWIQVGKNDYKKFIGMCCFECRMFSFEACELLL